MKTIDPEKSKLTHADLERFSGDLERYRTLNRNVIYTPGVRFLAERGGAYWLIDLIASYYVAPQMKRAIQLDERLETLHFWRLDVGPDRSATVSARADSEATPFITQELEYTDFPLDHVRIWSGFDGRYWTLYLPSEH